MSPIYVLMARWFLLHTLHEVTLKLLPRTSHKKPFKTGTAWERFGTYMHYLWADHAYLRIGFTNAHWIDKDMVRTNQPWPFQLENWKKQGVHTIINLRGGKGSFYYLEKYACDQLGLKMEDFGLTSRSLPTAVEIKAAKDLFDRVEYPALLHCKSGADRAGMMSVLYCHFHLKQPIEQAKEQLSFKYLHMKGGHTGVLDYLFEVYLHDIAPTGLSFFDWTQGPNYDPVALKEAFKPDFWGTLMSDKVLRRE